MTSALFWDITQRIVVSPFCRFGATCRYQLQGSRNPYLMTCFFIGTYIIFLIHSVKMCYKWRYPSPRRALHFFYHICLLSVYFYCAWCIDKHTGQVIHIHILVHSSFCAPNSMLSVGRPNFAEVARTTWNVVTACCRQLRKLSDTGRSVMALNGSRGYQQIPVTTIYNKCNELWLY